MLKFSANFTFQFQELPFLERFQAAKECGFQGVEYMYPYEYDPKEIANLLKELNLEQVMFNMPPPHVVGKEVGIAALPDRVEDFKEAVELTISYATELGCKMIHVPSGLVPSGEEYVLYYETCIENFRYAAKRFAPMGVTLLVEPLNRHTFPNYLIEKTEQARKLIEEIDEKNVGLQFDCYNVQVTEGNLSANFLENLDLIKHIQIAGVPGRHEPNVGEINYSYLFDIIEKSGYIGWIGCEYQPKTTTREGLGWLDFNE